MITILTPQAPALATVDDAGVSVGGQVGLAVMFAILQAVAAAVFHGPVSLNGDGGMGRRCGHPL